MRNFAEIKAEIDEVFSKGNLEEIGSDRTKKLMIEFSLKITNALDELKSSKYAISAKAP